MKILCILINFLFPFLGPADIEPEKVAKSDSEMIAESLGCKEGIVNYHSNIICTEDKPKTEFEEIKYIANEIAKPGETADMFIEGLKLYTKANIKSTVLYEWGRMNVDRETTAVILKTTRDFYFIEVSFYDGLNSCGFEANIVKKLRGYVPKMNNKKYPSLWKIFNMTGMC